MSQWVFHIGYQKTGSTWLQNAVFPHLAGLRYVGKSIGGDNSFSARFYPLLQRHEFDYDKAELDQLRAEEEARFPDAAVRLVSAEGLVGNPWRGGIDGPINLRRIAQSFPGAKIVLTIRNQPSMAESLYKQYLLEGGTGFPDVLFGPSTAHLDFRLSFLEYDKMQAFCSREFGLHQLLVLPHEISRTAPQHFVDRIASFLGVGSPVLGNEALEIMRPGYDSNLAYHVRWTNNFMRTNFNPFGWIQYPSKKMSVFGKLLTPHSWAAALSRLERACGIRRIVFNSKQCGALAERYRDSNRRLGHHVPDDLAALGYPA